MPQATATATLALIPTLDELDQIIVRACDENDPLGFFPSLYRRVTAEVKRAIENDEFEDSERVATLTRNFAELYLVAHRAYRVGQPHSRSWTLAFQQTKKYWPTTFQHLLGGVSAHINLDLGIAVAETNIGWRIEATYNDYLHINAVLAKLIDDTENKIAEIWPPLYTFDFLLGAMDETLAEFSLIYARDKAWEFALQLHRTPQAQRPALIDQRDNKVSHANKRLIYAQRSVLARLGLGLVRLGEKGTVSEKIQALNQSLAPPTS